MLSTGQAEARRLLSRSLIIRERALGQEHPDTGQSLNNLGTLEQREGRFRAAERLYQRALSV